MRSSVSWTPEVELQEMRSSRTSAHGQGFMVDILQAAAREAPAAENAKPEHAAAAAAAVQKNSVGSHHRRKKIAHPVSTVVGALRALPVTGSVHDSGGVVDSVQEDDQTGSVVDSKASSRRSMTRTVKTVGNTLYAVGGGLSAVRATSAMTRQSEASVGATSSLTDADAFFGSGTSRLSVGSSAGDRIGMGFSVRDQDSLGVAGSSSTRGENGMARSRVNSDVAALSVLSLAGFSTSQLLDEDEDADMDAPLNVVCDSSGNSTLPQGARSEVLRHLPQDLVASTFSWSCLLDRSPMDSIGGSARGSITGAARSRNGSVDSVRSSREPKREGLLCRGGGYGIHYTPTDSRTVPPLPNEAIRLMMLDPDAPFCVQACANRQSEAEAEAETGAVVVKPTPQGPQPVAAAVVTVVHPQAKHTSGGAGVVEFALQEAAGTGPAGGQLHVLQTLRVMQGCPPPPLLSRPSPFLFNASATSRGGDYGATASSSRLTAMGFRASSALEVYRSSTTTGESCSLSTPNTVNTTATADATEAMTVGEQAPFLKPSGALEESNAPPVAFRPPSVPIPVPCFKDCHGMSTVAPQQQEEQRHPSVASLATGAERVTQYADGDAGVVVNTTASCTASLMSLTVGPTPPALTARCHPLSSELIVYGPSQDPSLHHKDGSDSDVRAIDNARLPVFSSQEVHLPTVLKVDGHGPFLSGQKQTTVSTDFSTNTLTNTHNATVGSGYESGSLSSWEFQPSPPEKRRLLHHHFASFRFGGLKLS